MTKTFLIPTAALIAAGLAQAQQGTDPVIDAAREAAVAFTQSLPNYIVKRTTTRYQMPQALYRVVGQSFPVACNAQILGTRVECNAPEWQKLDVVTADVVSESGRETQLNLKVDGKPVQSPNHSGSWSVGEFVSVLQAALSLKSDAKFSNQRSTALAGRSAWHYDYLIDQPHSSWHLRVDASDYSPGYSGAIWIDKETSRVLRIDMAAHDMPTSFAMQNIDSSLEYGFVKIGEGNYLLPAHSQTVICQRTPAVCSKNTTDFQNYKKYAADAVISFDDKTN